MHEAGARHAPQLRVVRQQRILQGVLAVARARVHDHAGRLVQDDHARVLVDDIERQFFRGDGGLLLDAGLDAGRLAAGHEIARAWHEPIDPDRAGVDPVLDAGSGVLRKELRERLIEAPAGEFEGQLEAMSLELGGQPCGPSLLGAAILHASGDHFKL
jgi:hypothetical protein